MSFETEKIGGSFVRRCPQCGGERPVSELYCENGLPGGQLCHWPLFEEPIVRAGAAPAAAGASLPPAPSPASSPASSPVPSAAVRRCTSGHPLDPGDQICFVCGAEAAEAASASASASASDAASASSGESAAPAPGDELGPSVIDGWLLLRQVHTSEAADRYVARRAGDSGESGEAGAEVELTLYRPGAEPDRAVQEVLRRMPADHVPRLLAAGHCGEQAYEVAELIAGGTLEDVQHEAAADPQLLRLIVDELGRALESFAELSLRHRDLNPGNVVLRTREPLDLVVKGFGSARLSDFDLEAVAPLELTRYSAPEAIVGAVSAASDWWSLGMIVLELATAGACFEGVNDQAFRLHVVARGIALPAGLDPELALLLRGLLARDPLRRWAAKQVRAWLAGEAVEAPPAIDDAAEGAGEAEGRSLELAGRHFRRPEFFALAAAEAANWDAARELTLRGAVATWLGDRGAPEIAAQARRLLAAESLPDDFRHALTLMAMNPALPLTVRGEIVTPGWLLEHPREGYELIAGEVTRHLERMKREPWLVQLRFRAEQVRERARLLGIALGEERLRIALLATSRANLEAERDALRRIFPDTAHPGLASILERRQIPTEDLILLIAARSDQFLPLEGLLAATRELAAATGVPFDEAAAAELLVRPRREIFAAVDERTANFARCGHFEIDAWADAFRVERRMPLPRAAILLGMPAESFKEPPKQQYVATLLEHFEKRVAGGVSRGPLARFAIGKHTPRIDLCELGTGLRPAEAILGHVLSRAEVPVLLDPQAYFEGTAEARLRRLASQAMAFRRDTGLDGRILGFPFLWLREARSGGEPPPRPRLMPLLLWPVAFEMPLGAASPASLMFDREREEVRLNPALDGVLAPAALQQFRAARDEVLGRSSLKPGDVIDIFGALAPPRGRQLQRLPGRDASAEPGTLDLLPAAALFNAEFTGQSVAEDLRKMRQSSPAGTGLDALLRAGAEPAAPAAGAPARTPEQDRYLVVESDPSQEEAVRLSRQAPGLLVEGPPGTGKSQTIVNVIADAVGRGQTVLVVCQKQAALQVVKKRLEAEGLGDRLFLVVDINKDRELVIKSLRQQLEETRYATPGEAAALRRQREEKAARIEVIEAEIDRHHQALHEFDELAGASYRELLGELLALEAGKGYLDVPGLRPFLQDLGRGQTTRLEEVCAPLGRLWLAARYEGSPLAALSAFPADAAVAAALGGALAAFAAAEEARRETCERSPASFETDDPAPLLAWLRDQGARLETLSLPLWSSLAAWQALFRPEAGGGSAGLAALGDLEGALAALEKLAGTPHDEALARAVSALSPLQLQEELADAAAAVAPVSFFGRLNPWRWLVRRRVAARLGALGEPADDARMEQLRTALELERQLRPLRQKAGAAFELLALAAPPLGAAGALLLPALRREVALRVGELRAVAAAAAAVAACPRPQEAAAMVAAARPEAYAGLRHLFEAVAARHGARERSRAALAPLAAYFRGDWLAARQAEISRGLLTRAAMEPIVAALPTLIPYQQFRGRAERLDPAALAVFTQLRGREAVLLEVPPVHLEEALRRSIRREALLAAKGRIETRHDELRFERGEIERRVKALAELDRDLRRLNRELLGADLGAGQLGTATAWEDLTRLRGPRRKSLRELMALGRTLGLLRLRPIWLMNPDVASRVLPLEAGFFDLVVYDEASQMPVEHAVPTLFRARRILVSGDEKQMPPTRFFASAVEEEEEEVAEGDFFDETASSELERSALEERWNRREVKDCPDLLQLGRGALQPTTLQIHYRSQYRELISFSNAAFYGGGLSVPVRHPEAEVRRVRPVEVVRVDGTYEDQTNSAEAARVVELVAGLWSSFEAAKGEPPSLGVVTFNRKQADLIETLIQQRAALDPLFLLAYQRERERAQNGEDMSFFIKNVENVQGDERDMIVFSTTFGRDRRGAFRRNFGVLGQSGGERRLNVAVTRARQKVILVTSIPVHDVSDWISGERPPSQPRDFLQAYLDYAERLDAGNLSAAAASAKRLGLSAAARRRPGREQDGFQQAVGDFLRSRGWDWVRADEAGDAFGIDFAIEDQRTGLFAIGIECDSPRQALLERARAREIWRPQVLRRAIPVVHRVLSRSWYHRPHEERERLVAAVEAALRPAGGGREGETA